MYSPDVTFVDANSDCVSYDSCGPCTSDPGCGFCYEVDGGSGEAVKGSCVEIPNRYK